MLIYKFNKEFNIEPLSFSCVLHSLFLRPKLISFNSNWLVFWLPFLLYILTIKKGNQITSQLELKEIYLGCSKSECRTQLKDQGSMLNFLLIPISCISTFIHSWPIQISAISIASSFHGCTCLQPRCSCMD